MRRSTSPARSRCRGHPLTILPNVNLIAHAAFMTVRPHQPAQDGARAGGRGVASRGPRPEHDAAGDAAGGEVLSEASASARGLGVTGRRGRRPFWARATTAFRSSSVPHRRRAASSPERQEAAAGSAGRHRGLRPRACRPSEAVDAEARGLGAADEIDRRVDAAGIFSRTSFTASARHCPRSRRHRPGRCLSFVLARVGDADGTGEDGTAMARP